MANVAGGPVCPECKLRKTEVTDTRCPESGTHVYRRRRCLACGNRFSTVEIDQDKYERMCKAAAMLVRINALTQELTRGPHG